MLGGSGSRIPPRYDRALRPNEGFYAGVGGHVAHNSIESLVTMAGSVQEFQHQRLNHLTHLLCFSFRD
jgi:hypothetical protein